MFDKIEKTKDILVTSVMMITMSIATLVAFTNVVLRYVFNMSLVWAGELTSYLFIWSALFGAAYGFKIGMHIGVTALIQAIRPKVAKYILTVSLIITLIFMMVMVKWGYDLVMFNKMIGQVSVDLGIPFWVIYLCVPIAMIIAVYEILVKIIQIIRTPGEDFHYETIMKGH
ncbi:MAG: TRAP transporter small permease [Flexistipes sinusarabici]|uniref:TRAP transporter small permease n=1 Tax=Flexistipes sinusarabici TaxID=2352 RepID=A0A5D0MM51_FLESI|nr:TRAP transporter small permease [Flexistipes sinusarabici]TYB33472.1 MAG: TRAP transporter small permease [Flexistipes sinusarabici]